MSKVIEYIKLICLENCLVDDDTKPIRALLQKEYEKQKLSLSSDKDFDEKISKIKETIKEDQDFANEIEIVRLDFLIDIGNDISGMQEEEKKRKESRENLKKYLAGPEYKKKINQLNKVCKNASSGFKQKDSFAKSSDFFLKNTKDVKDTHYQGRVFLESVSVLDFSAKAKIRLYKYLSGLETGYLEFNPESESFDTTGEGIIYLTAPQKETKIAVFSSIDEFIKRLKDASENPYSASVSYVLMDGHKANVSEQFELLKIKRRAAKENLELELNL